jgi:hypothetical protein
LIVLSGVGCAHAGQSATTSAAEHTQLKEVNQAAADWELLVRSRYENKGIARIERIGERWVLSVWCRGIHTTYLDDTAFDLMQYQDLFVAVRYGYVDRSVPNPKCLRACPPLTERRIVLDRITPVPITLEQAKERARQCK